MRAGNAGGAQDRLRVGAHLKARNIVRNGAIEQSHILRQISNGVAEIVGAPLIERGAVEPDHALAGRPDADERLGKRRFSGCARPKQRQTAACRKPEGHVADDGPIGPRRYDSQAFG